MSEELKEDLPEGHIPEERSIVGLPSGDALIPADAYRFARRGRAPLVLLAGPVRSGKTTLIASVHDRFLLSPFARYWFAGSETLRAFEERCFDARVASGSNRPKTVRTLPTEGQRLYHLRLRSGGPSGATRNLLLMDMSGEFYKDVLDSGHELKKLEIARRADHFVLLVSGPMLFSGEVQAKIRANAATLIRRCVEGGVLGSDSRVDVLLTKWDVVTTLFPSTAEKVHESFAESLTKVYARRLRRLRILPVAARPHPGSTLTTPWGLDELLQSWLEELPTALDRRATPGSWPSQAHDMFDRFALKETPELFNLTI